MDIGAATRRSIGDRTVAWVGLLLVGAAIQAGLWLVSEPEALFGDFYKAYYRTAEILWYQGPHPTWRLDGTSEVGFVNIPIVAALFVPLVFLGEDGAGWVFLALGIVATACAWALLTRLARPGTKIGLLLLFCFLVSGTLVYSLREGNTTHFILLFLVVALLLLNAGRDYSAGLVLGVCAVIKLPLLLFGVYFLLRGRWKVVAGGVTILGLTLLLSLAVFGLDLNIGWYRNSVEPFLGKVIPAFNVQSIDGFLLRLKTGGDYLLYWQPIEPPTIHKLGRMLLFAAMLAGAYWLLRRAKPREPVMAEDGALSPRDLLEYVFVLNLALVISPISWTHYYLLLLLPWGLYLGGRLPLPDDAVTRWLMLGGFLLSSLPVVVLPLGAGWVDYVVSRTAVSAWLFGGLCMLAALARGLARSAAGFALPLSTRRIALFFVLNALVLNGVLWAVSPPDLKDTVLRHTWDFLHARSGGDSWLNMFIAYEYAKAPHATPLYEEVFFNRAVKFQYPPSSLFAIAAMQLAGIDRVRLGEQYPGPPPSINDILGWAFVLLMIVSVAALLHIQLKRSSVSVQNRISVAVCAVIAAAFTLTFYPMMKAYTLGQIQLWLNSIFSLLLLCWVLGRKAMSGVLMGLICLVKPHFGLFLVWALVRREWRFIIACSAVIVIGLAASLAVFGWADHVDYLRVVSHMGQRGEAYYPNQSINGLLNRLMSLSDPERYNNLEFRIGEFPPFNPWVYGATILSSAVILLAAIVWRSKEEDPNFDFCRMAVSLTIASPIAWEHHYGILLPIFAVALAGALEDRRRALWLMASYVLVSTFIPATNLLAPTLLNVGQSYVLAGAFVLLALLYARPAAAPVTTQQAGLPTQMSAA